METKGLTAIDAKIVTDLLKDGRKTLSAIANEAGEKKSTISKRLSGLEASGAITGSTIQLNYGALGYSAVGNLFFKIKPEYSDQAIERINKIPDIYSVYKQDNGTLVNVVATLKTMDEFNRVKELILRIPTVSNLTTNVWMGIRNMPYNLCLTTECPPINPIQKRVEQKATELDDFDKQLINMLSKNGREPFTSIAEKLGLGTNTIIRKYQRLKDEGIVNITIQVNPKKLGFHATASFNLAFGSQTNIPSIADEISSWPNIFLIIKTSGQFDLSVFCLIKDIESFLELQQKINQVADISKSQIMLRAPKPVLPGTKEYISTF